MDYFMDTLLRLTRPVLVAVFLISLLMFSYTELAKAQPAPDAEPGVSTIH